MLRTIFAAATLSCASLAMAACSQEPAEETAVAENTVAGVEVSNARLILPAVSGNPASLYFDLSYDGEIGTALRSLEVESAENAALHEYGEWNYEMVMQEISTLALQPGDTVSFKPEDRHGMVFGLADTVEPGAKVEATLIFAGGKRHAFEADVRGANDERE